MADRKITKSIAVTAANYLDFPMSVQLPLHIGLRDSATFSNFYPAGNEQLLTQLRQCAVNQGEHFIFLHGMDGTGKSHCLQAVCHAAAENQLQAAYLPMQDIRSMPVAALEGMEQLDVVCIDDIDQVAGDSDWETAIFNLYNRIRDNRGYLVVSASTRVEETGITLKDLQSRLVWGLVFRLESLDDDALAKALQVRARLRGMDLSDEVAAYILKRSARDMNSLFGLLEKLDHESLAAQRKLTIPFVKEFL